MTAPTIRLHLYHARDCGRTVILRKGPSKVFRMILWNRDDDTFEDGQWVKSKVYPERCDISPDGRHFIYFMLDGAWGSDAKGSYTVISRPPWFTALALFPQGDTWGGGGQFLDNAHYEVFSSPTTPDIIGKAEEMERIYSVMKQRVFDHWEKRGGAPFTPAPALKKRADWAVPMPDATRQRPTDQYVTDAGKLFRRDGEALTLIRDFTDMTFEAIRAPYADEVLARDLPPWHPLDGEAP